MEKLPPIQGKKIAIIMIQTMFITNRLHLSMRNDYKILGKKETDYAKECTEIITEKTGILVSLHRNLNTT